jgi:hypothetical protein
VEKLRQVVLPCHLRKLLRRKSAPPAEMFAHIFVVEAPTSGDRRPQPANCPHGDLHAAFWKHGMWVTTGDDCR